MSNIVAIDFGQGNALALHGPDGPLVKRDLRLPRVPGGATVSGDFARVVEHFFARGVDVVTESATIGSSGVEPEVIRSILEMHPDRSVLLLSTRVVKNYRMDHQIVTPKTYGKYETAENPVDQDGAHGLDAEILYNVALRNPERLKRWRYAKTRFTRSHRSVRPHDKRGYKGDAIDRYMERTPSFEDLPLELQEALGDSRGTGYLRAKVVPFLMALDEEGADTRAGYERIIGLYDHGYPCFYRRATVTWMQGVAKKMAGVDHVKDVLPATRKLAWRTTRRQIRQFYHLCRR